MTPEEIRREKNRIDHKAWRDKNNEELKAKARARYRNQPIEKKLRANATKKEYSRKRREEYRLANPKPPKEPKYKTKEEQNAIYYQRRKEHAKTYRQKNIEKLNRQSKEYYQANKEYLTAWHREYRCKQRRAAGIPERVRRVKNVCECCGQEIKDKDISTVKKRLVKTLSEKPVKIQVEKPLNNFKELRAKALYERALESYNNSSGSGSGTNMPPLTENSDIFELWYDAGKPSLLGSAEGNNFDEAVLRFARKNRDFGLVNDPDGWFYLGNKIYPNKFL